MKVRLRFAQVCNLVFHIKFIFFFTFWEKKERRCPVLTLLHIFRDKSYRVFFPILKGVVGWCEGAG